MDFQQDEVSHLNDLICEYLRISGENPQGMTAKEKKIKEKNIKDVCLREFNLICGTIGALTSSSRVDNIDVNRYLNGDEGPKIIRRPIHYRLQNISDVESNPSCVEFNPSADESLNFWENISMLSGISKKRAENQKQILQQNFTAYALEVKHYEALHGETYLFVPKIEYTLRDWVSLVSALGQVDQNSNNNLIQCVMRFLLSWLRAAIARRMLHGDLAKCIYFLDLNQPRLLVSEDFGTASSDDKSNFYQNDLDAVKGIFVLLINQCQLPDDLSNSNIKQFANMDLSNGIHPNFVNLYDDLNSFDRNRCVARVALNPSFLWHPIDEIAHIQSAYKYFFRHDRGSERRLFNKSGAWCDWQKIINNTDDSNLIKKFFISCTTKPPKPIAFDEYSDLLRLGRHAIEHLKENQMVNLSEVEILDKLNQVVNFSRRLSLAIHDFVKLWTKGKDKSQFLNAVAYPK